MNLAVGAFSSISDVSLCKNNVLQFFPEKALLFDRTMGQENSHKLPIKSTGFIIMIEFFMMKIGEYCQINFRQDCT
jgi:hypothetical protein